MEKNQELIEQPKEKSAPEIPKETVKERINKLYKERFLF